MNDKSGIYFSNAELSGFIYASHLTDFGKSLAKINIKILQIK